jgi:hypothetical protein
VALAAMVCCAIGTICRGQDLPDGSVIRELTARLDAQAAEFEDLRRRLDSQGMLYGPLSGGSSCDCGPKMRRLPVVAEDCWQPSCCETGDGV